MIKKTSRKTIRKEKYSKPPQKNQATNKTVVKHFQNPWSSGYLKLVDQGKKITNIPIVCNIYNKIRRIFLYKNVYAQPVTIEGTSVIILSKRKSKLLNTVDG